jgi:hypothetical protein
MDLDQLRRQAKQLVRAARAGNPTARARFDDLPVQLASAQLVVARDEGFTSWIALVHAARADYRAFVEELRGPSRQAAYERLLAAGPAASEAICAALLDDDPDVRRCALGIADHHLDEQMLPLVYENLGHRDGRVRKAALHALACDGCKEGSCRPADEQMVELALRFLRDDRSRRVRTEAASLLGPHSPLRPEVARALEQARDHDPHPVVREVARWYAPGGYNYGKRARQLGIGA